MDISYVISLEDPVGGCKLEVRQSYEKLTRNMDWKFRNNRLRASEEEKSSSILDCGHLIESKSQSNKVKSMSS